MSDEPTTGSTVIEETREVVIPSRQKKTDWYPIALAAVVMIGFFSVLEYLLRGEVPQSSHDIVLQMIETLKNITIMVVSYFVGTTVGSEKKTDIIAKSGPVDPH